MYGKDIKVNGRLVRVAQVDGDDFKFLDDPKLVLAELCRSKMRIDLFVFMQKLPDTSPKYAYIMEYDNLAVLPISTFDPW